MVTGVDFEGVGAPSGLTLKGENYVWPLDFLASNAHLALSVNLHTSDDLKKLSDDLSVKHCINLHTSDDLKKMSRKIAV